MHEIFSLLIHKLFETSVTEKTTDLIWFSKVTLVWANYIIISQQVLLHFQMLCSSTFRLVRFDTSTLVYSSFFWASLHLPWGILFSKQQKCLGDQLLARYGIKVRTGHLYIQTSELEDHSRPIKYTVKKNSVEVDSDGYLGRDLLYEFATVTEMVKLLNSLRYFNGSPIK